MPWTAHSSETSAVRLRSEAGDDEMQEISQELRPNAIDRSCAWLSATYILELGVLNHVNLCNGRTNIYIGFAKHQAPNFSLSLSRCHPRFDPGLPFDSLAGGSVDAVVFLGLFAPNKPEKTCFWMEWAFPDSLFPFCDFCFSVNGLSFLCGLTGARYRSESILFFCIDVWAIAHMFIGKYNTVAFILYTIPPDKWFKNNYISWTPSWNS